MSASRVVCMTMTNLYCFNNHTGHFDKDNWTNMATQLSTVLYTIKTKYTQYKLRTLRHENIMTLITRQSVTGPQFTRPSSMMPSQDPTGSHPCTEPYESPVPNPAGPGPPGPRQMRVPPVNWGPILCNLHTMILQIPILMTCIKLAQVVPQWHFEIQYLYNIEQD